MGIRYTGGGYVRLVTFTRGGGESRFTWHECQVNAIVFNPIRAQNLS